MSDIVERLRGYADEIEHICGGPRGWWEGFREAAAEIERLRARLAEAMKQIGALTAHVLDLQKSMLILGKQPVDPFNDVANARAFLATKVEEKPNETLKEVYRTGKAMLAASPDPATDEALVERVARAICDKWGYLWDGNPDDDYQVAPEICRGYDERPSRELFRSAARAAIRAMGEKP